MNNGLLVVNNLSYTIDNRTIFDNLNMNIKQGQIISIIGSNKCGKSTLINILGGIYHTNDMITIGKVTLNEKSKYGYYKKIGLINKDSDTSSERVNDYILEEVSRRDNNQFNYLLELFNIQNLLDKPLSRLSKDNFIKVEFCKALMKKPSILLIDYTNIDVSYDLKKVLTRVYKELVNDKISVIYTTNDINDILYSDITYVIHDGNIIISGDTKEVLKHDSLLLKVGIELPFEVDLSLKLKMYDLVDDIYFDIEKLVNKLWK